MLYAAETWALTERLEGLLASCDHRMLTEIHGKRRWQERITDEVRRCGMENLEL